MRNSQMTTKQHNKAIEKQMQSAFAIVADYRFEPNAIGVLIM
jgi:hypothetical protein